MYNVTVTLKGQSLINSVKLYKAKYVEFYGDRLVISTIDNDTKQHEKSDIVRVIVEVLSYD